MSGSDNQPGGTPPGQTDGTVNPGDLSEKHQFWQVQHQERTIHWLAVATTVGFFVLIGSLVILSYAPTRYFLSPGSSTTVSTTVGTGNTVSPAGASQSQQIPVSIDQDYKGIVLTLAGVLGTGWASVIGYYFGSSVGSRQQAQTINSALQSSIQNQTPSTGNSDPQPDPTQLSQKLTAIGSLSDSVQSKLAAIGDPSLAAMTQDVNQHQPPPPAMQSALQKATAAFQTLTAQAASCATDASRAKDASAALTAAGSDATQLPAIATRVAQLDTDSATANHQFLVALDDFNQSRSELLGYLAQG